MALIGVDKNPEELTITIHTEFDATVERVWQIWADPRQLEKWWGPPTWPATVNEHSLEPGGGIKYFMTGPDGTKAPGWFKIISTDAPRHLTFEEGFADENGDPDSRMPSMVMSVAISERSGGGAKMTVETKYPSIEAMEQLIAMGMLEGMSEAVGQIDALLAA
jgi:uncharacterized protein YndB with AHSA1/START domain